MNETLKCVVGIDPGQTGSIAAIRADGKIWVRDYPGDERAVWTMLGELGEWGTPGLVVLEEQQAMPKQGVTSAFGLGRNYGIWLMAIAAKGWALKLVRPANWKKNLGYPEKKKEQKPPERKKELKAHSLTLARRLYPESEQYLLRVKDHDRAEAIIIAHYGKEELWRKVTKTEEQGWLS